MPPRPVSIIGWYLGTPNYPWTPILNIRGVDEGGLPLSSDSTEDGSQHRLVSCRHRRDSANSGAGHGAHTHDHDRRREAFDHASNSELKPVKLTGTMAFMFETRYPQHVTAHAVNSQTLQDDYADCWKGLEKRFDPKRR